MLQWSRGQGEHKNSGLRGAGATSSWPVSSPMTQSLPCGPHQAKKQRANRGYSSQQHMCTHPNTQRDRKWLKQCPPFKSTLQSSLSSNLTIQYLRYGRDDSLYLLDVQPLLHVTFIVLKKQTNILMSQICSHDTDANEPAAADYSLSRLSTLTPLFPL